MKKKKIRVVLLLIVASLLGILACLYFFGDHHVSTDEMHGEVKAIEKDGRIYFEYEMTDSGIIGVQDEVSQTVLYDYENGIQYRYYYMCVTAQRFHLLLNKGTIVHESFVLDETGREIHRGKWQFDPTVDYTENPTLMGTRYLRVYYENPDGSMILVWEHPQAKEIEERIGTPVKDPEEYKIGVKR